MSLQPQILIFSRDFNHLMNRECPQRTFNARLRAKEIGRCQVEAGSDGGAGVGGVLVVGSGVVVFSLTPCPRHIGHEFRPVVSHYRYCQQNVRSKKKYHSPRRYIRRGTCACNCSAV